MQPWQRGVYAWLREHVERHDHGPPPQQLAALAPRLRRGAHEGKPDKGEGQGKQQQTQTETDKGLIMNAVEPFHMHGQKLEALRSDEGHDGSAQGGPSSARPAPSAAFEDEQRDVSYRGHGQTTFA
eukprot:2659827-Pyramimonas_sp.AAC.1